MADREAASSSPPMAEDITSGSSGFDIFSLLASHHDLDLMVRGGLLTAFAQ